MKFILVFSLFFLNGSEQHADMFPYTSLQECEAKAAKFHYYFNQWPNVLGTEHKCVILPSKKIGT